MDALQRLERQIMELEETRAWRLCVHASSIYFISMKIQGLVPENGAAASSALKSTELLRSASPKPQNLESDGVEIDADTRWRAMGCTAPA